MSDDVAAKLATAAQSPELPRLMRRSPTRATWSICLVALLTIFMVGAVPLLWWLVLFELHGHLGDRVFFGIMNTLVTGGAGLAAWVVLRHFFKPLHRVVAAIESRELSPGGRQRFERWNIRLRTADGRTIHAECMSERIVNEKCIVNHVGVAYLLDERLLQFERLA